MFLPVVRILYALNRMGGNATEQVQNQGGGTNPNRQSRTQPNAGPELEPNVRSELWRTGHCGMQSATNKNKQRISKE
jgi:hypothetical protein